MAVYFIQAGDAGPVKIGYAVNVLARLREIQCGNAEPLHLIREDIGGRLHEAALHDRFRHLRLRGEWFVFSPDMLTVEVVADMRSKTAIRKARSASRAPCPLKGDWPPERVLSLVDRHIAASGETATTIGRALGDPCLISDIRKGREPGRRIVYRVLQYIGEASPDSKTSEAA